MEQGQSDGQKFKVNTEEEVVVEAVDHSAEVEQIGEEVDDLLDEIDAVLEENAEEFVRGYVQKGGE